jgi:hypothetical protein
MKIQVDFSELNKLVELMGATAIPSFSKHIPISGNLLEILETKGFDVDIKSIEFKKDGAFFNGEQILLYIKDVNKFASELQKFHLYECRTLIDMQNQGAFEKKYVATKRKDGVFFVDFSFKKKFNQQEKLNVCKNCLKWYNDKTNHNQSVQNFSIAQFFDYFGNSIFTHKPMYSDINSPQSGYTADWDDVSKKCKEKCKYVCQECKIDLKMYKHLLETHHKNRTTLDNSSNNLIVLCVECHSKQFKHNHMKYSHAAKILEVQQIRARSLRNN